MKPILGVKHQSSAPLGTIAPVLEANGVPYEYYDAFESAGPPDVAAYSGVIVLGGEMNVDELEEFEWLAHVRSLIGDTLEADLPLLGICLGAQTLARVLGAEVKPAAVREVGFHDVTPTDDGRRDPVAADFDGVPVFQWHEDAFELPDDATLLLSGDVVANQAFRYGERAYGVQFHLEIEEQLIAQWCDETDAQALVSEWGTTKEALLAEASRHLAAQRRAAAQAVRAFVAMTHR